MLWSLQSKSRIKTITKFRLLLRNNSQKSSKKNEAFFCFRRWYWHWKNIIHCLFILHRISNNNFVKIYIFSSEIKVYHPLYKFSTQIIPFQSLQLWRNQFGFVLLGEAKYSKHRKIASTYFWLPHKKNWQKAGESSCSEIEVKCRKLGRNRRNLKKAQRIFAVRRTRVGWLKMWME